MQVGMVVGLISRASAGVAGCELARFLRAGWLVGQGTFRG